MALKLVIIISEIWLFKKNKQTCTSLVKLSLLSIVFLDEEVFNVLATDSISQLFIISCK